MRAFTQTTVLTAVLCLGFFSSPLLAQKQQPKVAPLPTLLSSAKTAFISDITGGSSITKDYSDRPYNSIYAALAKWDRFQIVTRPTEADVILEFRLASNGSHKELSLTVVDPKTHAALWAFSQDLADSPRRATREKYIDQTIAALIGALKDLVEEASNQ
ncbi:MAG TPA: hypothetical protein VKT53_04995 [Candidatus Acidoferrum sp.]|nr:hypothetical protein [Candidatus Acidoferrum sp.]